MDQEPVQIDEKQLQILATQLGILLPNYDPSFKQESFPTTDPGPRIPSPKKDHAELV